MLDPDPIGGGIEISKVTAAHVHGTDAKARMAGVDPIEIDQAFERGFQRGIVIVAGRIDAPPGQNRAGGIRGTKKLGVPKQRIFQARARLMA